ncbi:MAG: M23 family metallopeptidase [Oscillospiraceae bacterium]|nr:M23 family metallopeptidase [Oscillospiraceae bacterium]
MLRGVRRFFNRLRGSSYSFLEKLTEDTFGLGQQIMRRMKAPFIRLGNVRGEMKPVIEKSKNDGKIPVWAYGQIVGTFARLLYAIVRTLVNHALPILAAFLLFVAVRDRIDVQQSVGLAVTYNDQHIGMIHHETIFEDAIQELKDRFFSEEDIPIVLTPQFTLRELEEHEVFADASALADRIVEASGGEIANGFGVFIDDIFLGAYHDVIQIIEEFDYILDSHRTGIEGERVEFLRRVSITREGVFPLSSIRSFEEIREDLHGNDPNAPTTSYTVVDGDTLSQIAQRLEISYQSLVDHNPTLVNGGLFPGQVLNVPIAQPLMQVQNIRTVVFPEEFPFDIEEVPSVAYVRGFRSISTVGQFGVREVTAEVAEVNGVEVSREIMGTRVLRAPVTQRVIVGTNNPGNITSFGSVSSQGFLWPTQGGVITVGLWGYPGHTGVDIPRPAGTPIFASAAGTVVRVVHGRVGYGHYVVIDHHNGYTTLYAHASAIHVSVGQRVNQGDVIASVGRTGNSTGNHLHFEVRRHGQIMNPAHYLQR